MLNVRYNYMKCKRLIYRYLGATIAVTALFGCAVGPEFKQPETPKPANYTATALPEKTVTSSVAGGEAQHFISGQDIPDQWWTLFHSKELDQLIHQALANSPSLAAAQATLREAQENWRAQYGTIFPTVDANVSASREKISGAFLGQPNTSVSPFNLYNASVNVSYNLDIFGGTQRELEALRSLIDYQRFQLEGAYLTLTSNIITTAVKEASLRAQIRTVREILEVQKKELGVVEQQLKLGGVALSDVLAQRSQLAQTRAVLPPLEKDLEVTHHLLAVLTGKLPSEVGPLKFDLNRLKLPQKLPVSLPSDLVRLRPDIRASEAFLHAASAQVGVATANLYPQITLTGSYGTEATKASDLFAGNSVIWNLGAGLLQPVFHGGALTAKRRAAIASYDQAAAQYRSTVLLAFQNVADVLRSLEADAYTLQAQAEAEKAARESFDLTQNQFQVGAVSYLSLLNAERQYQQARINLVQAQATRFADTAALFQALGGGWWNRKQSLDTRR
jgi:NodT family efflux transporter outer membrane factor (OMF) lipoprotein